MAKGEKSMERGQLMIVGDWMVDRYTPHNLGIDTCMYKAQTPDFVELEMAERRLDMVTLTWGEESNLSGFHESDCATFTIGLIYIIVLIQWYCTCTLYIHHFFRREAAMHFTRPSYILLWKSSAIPQCKFDV